MDGYLIERHRTFAIVDGAPVPLANFVATIEQETRYIDDASPETWLEIHGVGPDPDSEDSTEGPKPIRFPIVNIPATEFATMGWVLKHWGTRAVLATGGSVKDQLRHVIQMTSKPKVTTVYRHLGWTQIGKEYAYLHARGAIKAKGNDPSIRVELPPELTLYDLSRPVPPKQAWNAAALLLEIGAYPLTWTMLAASLAPLFGPVDFAVHLSGRTGTFKTELSSLFQSLYGAGMDARHLPGSWSSTANALEAQAWRAKNTVFSIDDFVPMGTSYQVKSYQTTADKIIRAQGNQAGRARLTDTSALQATMYPRGLVLSSGEDIPEGHSVRARMMILELSPGDINIAKLTAAQARRKDYTGLVAAIVQDLATNPIDLRPDARKLRDANLGVGHSRTPAMLGQLLAVVDWFTHFLARTKLEQPNIATALNKDAHKAITKAADLQNTYLEASDPTDLFIASIRQAFGAFVGHARTPSGGIPLKSGLLGWTTEKSTNSEPTWKAHGHTIGWVDWDVDELYIDYTSAFPLLRKLAGPEMGLQKQTLLRRLKDAGCLKRIDEGRGKNMVRVNCDGHTRNVVVLSLSTVLETKEKP